MVELKILNLISRLAYRSFTRPELLELYNKFYDTKISKPEFEDSLLDLHFKGFTLLKDNRIISKVIHLEQLVYEPDISENKNFAGIICTNGHYRDSEEVFCNRCGNPLLESFKGGEKEIIYLKFKSPFEIDDLITPNYIEGYQFLVKEVKNNVHKVSFWMRGDKYPKVNYKKSTKFYRIDCSICE